MLSITKNDKNSVIMYFTQVKILKKNKKYMISMYIT